MDYIIYIGLDVRDDLVAVAECRRDGDARRVRFSTTAPRSCASGSKTRQDASLSFCYEVGPCDYGLHR